MDYRRSLSTWAVLCVALAVAGLGMARLFGFLVDDAFISFRYAENLAAGRGLVFNPGERVEGYSNLGWVLILAALHRAGAATPAGAQALGCLAGLGGIALTLFLRRRTPAPFAALLLAASLPWLLWAVSGMETLFYAFLLLLAAFGLLRAHEEERWFRRSTLCAGLATITRPEGLLLVLAMGAAFALDLRGAPRRRVLGWLALPLACYLAQTAFRLAYYGAWLPNTYYAKSGPLLWQLGRGLERYAEFFAERGLWALFLLPCLAGLWPALRRQPAALLAAAVALAQSAFFIQVGGDWMALHRFLVPLLPFLFLLWQIGTETLVERAGRRAWARALAALLAAGTLFSGLGPTLPGRESLWAFAQRYATGYRQGLERTSIATGRLLRDHAPPDAVIALGDAGALPYYSGLAILDLYGLMNPELARLPGHALYFDPASFDVGTILARRPEFFYLNSMNDFMTRGEPLRPLPHLKIDAMIYEHQDFRAHYRWILSTPFSATQWCHLFARVDILLEGWNTGKSE